jgi:NAD(P)-dependent dehydrogenase (short-subunit alcohol dehydrogenase family)
MTGRHGRPALVVGAVGDGGRAAPTTLAALGARVIVADGDRAALEGEYAGDERFDLSPALAAGADDLEVLAAALPDIDVVVHRPLEPHAASDAGRAESGIDAIRHFVPAMTRRRRGSIITLTCSTTTRPAGGRGLTPSPAGRDLHQVVRGLASELRPFGVRVNAVEPHGIEPTAAVAFLASDASAHVTGAVLAVERGWSALESMDERPASAASLHPLGAGFGAGRDQATRGLTALPQRPTETATTMNEEAYERRRA